MTSSRPACKVGEDTRGGSAQRSSAIMLRAGSLATLCAASRFWHACEGCTFVWTEGLAVTKKRTLSF